VLCRVLKRLWFRRSVDGKLSNNRVGSGGERFCATLLLKSALSLSAFRLHKTKPQIDDLSTFSPIPSLSARASNRQAQRKRSRRKKDSKRPKAFHHELRHHELRPERRGLDGIGRGLRSRGVRRERAPLLAVRGRAAVGRRSGHVGARALLGGAAAAAAAAAADAVAGATTPAAGALTPATRARRQVSADTPDARGQERRPRHDARARRHVARFGRDEREDRRDGAGAGSGEEQREQRDPAAEDGLRPGRAAGRHVCARAARHGSARGARGRVFQRPLRRGAKQGRFVRQTRARSRLCAHVAARRHATSHLGGS